MSEEEVHEIPVKTPEELAEIARGIATDRIFTSLHITPADWDPMLGLVFMPLGLGALAGYRGDDVGLIYAPMDKAGPRSVNGYPCFFVAHVLNRAQTDEVIQMVARARQALDDVFTPEGNTP